MAHIEYADATKVGDEYRRSIIARIESAETKLYSIPLIERRRLLEGAWGDEDIEGARPLRPLPPATADEIEARERETGLRMYGLWRNGRLPDDVVVVHLVAPMERTGYGDYRRAEGYVFEERHDPAPNDRVNGVSVTMRREFDAQMGDAGAWVWIGWSEQTRRLVVATEKRSSGDEK